MIKEKIIIQENELTLKLTDEQKELKKETFKNMLSALKEKDFEKIKSIAEEVIPKLPTRALGEGDKEISEIYFLYASALKELGEENNVVIKNAITSSRFNRLNKNALWLIRETKNILAAETELFRFQVVGKMYRMYREDEIEDIFKTIYTVAAEDEIEAEKFIDELERPEVVQDYDIVKTFKLGKRSDLPKGIYETIKLMQWIEKGEQE